MSVALKNLVVIVLGTAVFAHAAPAQACHRDRGGGYRAVYRPVVQYQYPYAPAACRPAPPQPQVVQPGYSVPPSSPVVVTVHGQGVGQAVRPAASQGASAMALGALGTPASGFGSTAPLAGAPEQQGVAPAGFTGPASAAGAAPVGSATPVGSGATQTAAPGVLGNATVQQAAPNAPISTPPSSAVSNVATAPPAAAPAAPSTKDAATLALEALGLLGDGTAAATAPPAAPTASEPSAPAVATTGDFVAAVPSGATVRLSLLADGSFRWSATKDGKASHFQGTFTLQGASLTLLRSQDNQKLEGTLTLSAQGFTLKLAGQNDNGLQFVRS